MRLLHQDAPPGALRVARLWVFGIWIAKLVTEPLERLAEFPPANLPPIGVLKLVPAAAWPWLLTAAALLTFRVFAVSCLLASCVGPRQTVAAVVSCLLLTFHQGLVRSIGYVNHSELPLLYAVYILTAAAVLDRVGGKPPSEVPPAPTTSGVALMAIAMVLCFTYTATALSRLLLGAPAVFHPDTPTAWIAGYSFESTYHGWRVGRAVLNMPMTSRAFLSVGLVAVTTTELLAPCCLVSRRFRRFFVTVMVPFHLVTYVTMNILFWENLALYLFLFDSAGGRPVFAPGPRRRGSILPGVSAGTTTITGFHQDSEGSWVAELACGHTQHVRHRPPWQLRPWVVNETERARKIGAKIDCPLCQMPALPPDVREYKRTATFTEDTLPAGLLRDHRTKQGTWARIVVEAGQLEYGLEGSRCTFLLTPESPGVVAPTVPHHVTPLGAVRFHVEFLTS